LLAAIDMDILGRKQNTRNTEIGNILEHGTEQGGFELGYRPALDGLRGLCVLLVIASHTGLPFTSGGFLGVDGFFVLSGFLITSLLVQEHMSTGTVNFASFYARRALRLFPALLTLLLVCVIGTLLFASGQAAEDNWRGMGSAVIYLSNWVLATAGPGESLGVLQHTWSLAIEEQFYLLWPLLLSFVILRQRRVNKVALVALLIGLSIITRIMLAATGAGYWRIYAGSDARADALLTGCLVGLAISSYRLESLRQVRAVTRLCLVVALPALAFLVTTADGHHAFFAYWGYTLVAVGMGSIILHLMVSPTGHLAGAFSWTPLIKVGMISYGLYLWHYPVFEMLKPEAFGWNEWQMLVPRLALTLFAAIVSFRYIERPVLRLKERLSKQSRQGEAADHLLLPGTSNRPTLMSSFGL
jgi:peptidoglycan/LPS O-acetylase OafA/YrhL